MTAQVGAVLANALWSLGRVEFPHSLGHDWTVRCGAARTFKRRLRPVTGHSIVRGRRSLIIGLSGHPVDSGSRITVETRVCICARENRSPSEDRVSPRRGAGVAQVCCRLRGYRVQDFVRRLAWIAQLLEEVDAGMSVIEREGDLGANSNKSGPTGY